MADEVCRPEPPGMMGTGVPPLAGRKRRLQEPGVAPTSRMYALPAGSTVTAEGSLRALTTVLTVPGVKTPSAPVARASSPWETVFPEIESVSLIGALRRPRRVGVKRTKTWQVTGGVPGVEGLRIAVQVFVMMLKSGPEVTERFTF